MQDKSLFNPGRNISIKTPNLTYKATVEFYKEIIGLELLEETESSTAFDFGNIKLWIDKVNNLSHSDVWLELYTTDVNKASEFLSNKAERRDEVEKLPSDFPGFWISSPNGVIHLISEDK